VKASPVIAALQFARAEELAAAVDAPRSWSKEAKLAFLHLPAQLQEYYAAREKDRDRAVRVAQNSAAAARKALAVAQQQLAEAQQELAALKQSKETEDGNTQQDA
jgi:hypothetical protein